MMTHCACASPKAALDATLNSLARGRSHRIYTKLPNETKKDQAETLIKITREKKPETVKDLVTLAKQERSLPEREILKLVIELQSNGQIKFTEHSVATPSTLSTHLKTSPPIWYCATIALAVITTICVFTVLDNLIPMGLFKIRPRCHLRPLATRLHLHTGTLPQGDTLRG